MSTRDELLSDIEARTADSLSNRAGVEAEQRKPTRLLIRNRLAWFLLPMTLLATSFTTGLLSPRPQEALAYVKKCWKPAFVAQDHSRWCNVSTGYYYDYRYRTSGGDTTRTWVCYHFKQYSYTCGGMSFVGNAKRCRYY